MSERDEKQPHIDLALVARDVATQEGFVVGADDGAPRELPAEVRRDPADVRDRRALLWSSIDNRESTDLDQIEVSERLPDGSIRICIGIADVDVFVPKGSAIDRRAAQNTTSLYAGVATFPMLPDDLSSDATSLLANVDQGERVAAVELGLHLRDRDFANPRPGLVDEILKGRRVFRGHDVHPPNQSTPSSNSVTSWSRRS